MSGFSPRKQQALTANQQFVLGMEPSLPRAFLGGENLITHFETPSKILSIWIARLRGNVRGDCVWRLLNRSNLRAVDVISVRLILRMPDVLSGVQDFLGQEQFLENISRELADMQSHLEARMG